MKKLISLAALMCLSLSMMAQSGPWSGKLSIQGTSLTIVINFNEDGCTMDSPDQGVKGIPAAKSITPEGKLQVSVAAIGASFEGVMSDGQIVGTFKQGAAVLPLTLTPGASKPNRPQTPVGPFPYTSEELSFNSGDAVLRGTLTLPQGYCKDTPVLLMVTGSGLQDRDETLFEHKPFAVIADALARAGIATLRYDDRGFGESTGDAVNATTDTFKADAAAGVELLRSRFSKVGLIGHSEGGTIALMLAAEGKIDFAVSLAGMAVSGRETVLQQNEHSLRLAGIDDATIAQFKSVLNDTFDRIHAGEDAHSPKADALPEMLKQAYEASLPQLVAPFMSYFVTVDASKVLGKIRCPLLAFNGTMDTQVACEQNLGVIREKVRGAEIVAVEGANHLLQHCKTGEVQEYSGIEETIAPEVLSKIVEWVKGLR